MALSVPKMCQKARKELLVTERTREQGAQHTVKNTEDTTPMKPWVSDMSALLV
jgi:hypothetical protein